MKVFTLKLAADLHTKVKIAAAQSGKSMMEWILEAISEKLGE